MLLERVIRRDVIRPSRGDPVADVDERAGRRREPNHVADYAQRRQIVERLPGAAGKRGDRYVDLPEVVRAEAVEVRHPSDDAGRRSAVRSTAARRLDRAGEARLRVDFDLDVTVDAQCPPHLVRRVADNSSSAVKRRKASPDLRVLTRRRPVPFDAVRLWDSNRPPLSVAPREADRHAGDRVMVSHVVALFARLSRALQISPAPP